MYKNNTLHKVNNRSDQFTVLFYVFPSTLFNYGFPTKLTTVLVFYRNTRDLQWKQLVCWSYSHAIRFHPISLFQGKVKPLPMLVLTACRLQCYGKAHQDLILAICSKLKTLIVWSECCESKQVQLLITSVLLTALDVFLFNVGPLNGNIWQKVLS